ncbi:SGNH/GDSL hydrolase family protein [Gordonia rubripertincta]|uniref:SGNH/GDSL hydrolase family protein n=1 Tax=Gordonia rubripertincta TaxID=36822 RepID=A0ABT4MXQ3_GORRU|nr:SGNH/GDSL hydrolase family protein [Gordonia rubripertincta]MCZ4551798.1 SGNH/GDSL hydrolase family protein [Gordonia rubripertincta]
MANGGRRKGNSKRNWGISFIVVAALVIGGGFWYDSTRVDDSTVTAQPQGSPGELESDTLDVPRTPKSGPTFVTFLGDSITDGWGASVYEKSYRALLVDEWRTSGRVDPVVTAIAGATLSEVAAKANIPDKSSLVIIELGTNAAARPRPPPASSARTTAP